MTHLLMLGMFAQDAKEIDPEAEEKTLSIIDLLLSGGAVSYTHLTLPTTPYV